VEDEPFLFEGGKEPTQDMVQVTRSAALPTGELLADVSRGDLAQVQAGFGPAAQDG
jgi:hypothetical protein